MNPVVSAKLKGSGEVVVPLGAAKASGCTKAPKAVIEAIETSPNRCYVNIHNVRYPGGALRGPARCRDGRLVSPCSRARHLSGPAPCLAEREGVGLERGGEAELEHPALQVRETGDRVQAGSP